MPKRANKQVPTVKVSQYFVKIGNDLYQSDMSVIVNYATLRFEVFLKHLRGLIAQCQQMVFVFLRQIKKIRWILKEMFPVTQRSVQSRLKNEQRIFLLFFKEIQFNINNINWCAAECVLCAVRVFEEWWQNKKVVSKCHNDRRMLQRLVAPSNARSTDMKY